MASYLYKPFYRAVRGWLPEQVRDNFDNLYLGFRTWALIVSIGGGVAIVVAVYSTNRALRNLCRRSALKAKRAKKRLQCNEALEQLAKDLTNSKLSDDERNGILKLNLEDLITKLRNRELKALDVLEAYQHAALEAHRQTNCLVEPIVEAKALAASLDAEDTPRGPLHGVPVSLKDNYAVKGYDSTLGCSRRIGKAEPEDAVIVQVLKKLGAVPFVKTNVPQTMMTTDTNNPIFGQTTTPYDDTRTAGGSSGGEAAILACGGAPLGVGSDVGGSIRVPAHFCGVTGFKCTYGRLSPRGSSTVMRGQNLVNTNLGPMGRDVDSLVTALRHLQTDVMFSLDSSMPPMPFDEEAYNKPGKLRIGVYYENPVFKISEPCVRAVQVAAKAMEGQGHEIVLVDMTAELEEAYRLFVTSTCADGGELLLKAIKHDVVTPSMMPMYMTAMIPDCLKTVLAALLSGLHYFPAGVVMVNALKGIGSISNWWSHCSNVQEFRWRVADKWKSLGLDAVIAPFSLPAMLSGDPMRAGGMLTSVTIYNLLDFPGGTLPVTKVTDEDEEVSKKFPCRDPWHYIGKRSLRGMVGLPVGVQVIGLPFRDETALRAMKELETALKE